MATLREWYEAVTALRCLACNSEIPRSTRYYVEYPRDTYCAGCAQSRPGFTR